MALPPDPIGPRGAVAHVIEYCVNVVDDAQAQGSAVVRKDQEVTASVSDFATELRKAPGVRQVQQSIRLCSVTIATRDQRPASVTCELAHLRIFGMRSKPVEFDGVDGRTTTL